jgi:2-oxoglutarate ferredoxin oxidoreductase subunit alpha
LANGSEPWRLPDVHTLEAIDPKFATEPNHVAADGTPGFWPYLRDPETLARAWATPGTPGLVHRIGGLEKSDGSGDIDYDPANHERMTHLRAAKVAGVAASIPPVEVEGDPDADLLVLGWGSTWGAIGTAARRVRAAGHKVANASLMHLNPFPDNLGDVVRRHRQVLVPELNLGQLTRLVRAEFLVDARAVSKVQGLPFTAAELEHHILAALDGLDEPDGRGAPVPEVSRG